MEGTTRRKEQIDLTVTGLLMEGTIRSKRFIRALVLLLNCESEFVSAAIVRIVGGPCGSSTSP
jgi:hypothetical protein